MLRGISLPLHRGAQPLAWRGISLTLGGIFPYSEGNFCYSWGVSPSLNGIPLNPYLNGNSHLLWGGDSHSLSGASPLSDRHSSVTLLSALGEFPFTSEAPPPVLLGPFLFHSFLFNVGGDPFTLELEGETPPSWGGGTSEADPPLTSHGASPICARETSSCHKGHSF